MDLWRWILYYLREPLSAKEARTLTDPKPMPDEQTPKAALLKRIATKREQISAFLSKSQPRSRKLVNTAIICGALAAALTAGPAFGGSTMTAWLTETLGLKSPVWQLLCLGSTICSVTAAIATNMSKSHAIASKILSAQACNAKLEGLELLIEMNQVDAEKSAALYTQYLTEISFVGGGA